MTYWRDFSYGYGYGSPYSSYGAGPRYPGRGYDLGYQRNDFTRNQYNNYRGSGSPFLSEARYSPINYGGNLDFASRYMRNADRNRDGHVDRFEFQQASGVNTSRLRGDQYQQALDVNRDGTVDYREAGAGLIATERSNDCRANGGVSAPERDAMNWRLSTYDGREGVRREVASLSGNNPFRYGYNRW